jgi:DNA (cytosine-5)-methyltransferase 3A
MSVNILSFFDGCSAAQCAINKIGISNYTYCASEIEKHAISVTQSNFPRTKQLGDVRQVDLSSLGHIDLFVAGPECQSYSVAGKMDASALWQIELCRRVLDEVKPRYFLIENVKSKGPIVAKISEILGVNPVLINSAHFVAQNRERNYWTNIPIGPLPDIKNSPTLADICTDDSWPICLSSSGRGSGVVERRVSNNLKAHTLTRTGYSRRSFSGYITKDIKIRNFTRNELEAIQGFPKDYTTNVSESHAQKMLGNSFTVDTIAHILKGMEIMF